MFRTVNAEPAELQRLADAFDAAWIEVNVWQTIDAVSASAERERLSCILIHVWQADPAADLAAVAVKRFLSGAVTANTSTPAELSISE